MATTARKTVTIDDLPRVVERLGREQISHEVVLRRRRLSAEANKVVDEMDPLGNDVFELWIEDYPPA